MSRETTAVVAAVLAALAVVIGYVGLGGGDFEPAPAPAPCGRQAASSDDGVGGTVERIGLNALGLTACDLGVSRERLLLGLAGEAELDVDRERRTEAFRSGLQQAIDAEQRAGGLGAAEAFVLRQAVGFLPIDALLDRLFATG